MTAILKNIRNVILFTAGAVAVASPAYAWKVYGLGRDGCASIGGICSDTSGGRCGTCEGRSVVRRQYPGCPLDATPRSARQVCLVTERATVRTETVRAN